MNAQYKFKKQSKLRSSFSFSITQVQNNSNKYAQNNTNFNDEIDPKEIVKLENEQDKQRAKSDGELQRNYYLDSFQNNETITDQDAQRLLNMKEYQKQEELVAAVTVGLAMEIIEEDCIFENCLTQCLQSICDE